ncbi:hypothetical protein E4U21_000766 [Claviceps maximensis]|nr:hypothetical protein E4U21_000766 [Claviceps maximensis]
MSSNSASGTMHTANPASKKKHNKKKKSASNIKNKDPSPLSNGDAQPENENHGNDDESGPDVSENTKRQDSPEGNGCAVEPAETAEAANVDAAHDSDPAAKLEAMSKEREALRAEVEQLRKQLESIQTTHGHELAQMKADLEDSNSAKEHAEEQYQTLLERVEKIKESLSDRLKRDKAELEEARERIEELEAQNEQLQGSAQSTGNDVDKLKQELQDATRELSVLRSRNNLSAHNWHKEKEELTKTVQHLKEEMKTTANAMGEWEVLAMEERSIKENLLDKVSDLEEQIATLKHNYEAAAADRDSQSTLVDNLQNALREIQEARKRELRDMVETTESQLQALKTLVQQAEARATEAEEAREEMTKELERTAPFENEVREKNLLIGKLRHEGIVLNDHLTKALRYLKRTKPEDNVDRQVVTNHLLHFLTFDRGDAKRFQVLQVMAGYLNWTDEQREQAGLSRPGASTGALRLPTSPFQRTPSSPSLRTDIFSEPTSAKDRESLSELWASFLERSAQEGGASTDAPAPAGAASSRKSSINSTTTKTTDAK